MFTLFTDDTQDWTVWWIYSTATGFVQLIVRQADAEDSTKDKSRKDDT